MIAVGIIGSILLAHRPALFEPLVPADAGLGLAARLPRRARRLVHDRGRTPALDRLWRIAHGRRGIAGSGRQRPLLLLLFVLVYGIVFGAGLYYIVKLVRRGPDETPPVPEAGEADLSHRPMAAAGNP